MSERNPKILAEFRQRRSRQLTASVAAILVILFAAMRGDRGLGVLGLPEAVVGGLLAAVILGIVAFSLFNWRCPGCNRYLGKSINPKFCPSCGAHLHD
jgi:hypothetical protein